MSSKRPKVELIKPGRLYVDCGFILRYCIRVEAEEKTGDKTIYGLPLFVDLQGKEGIKFTEGSCSLLHCAPEVVGALEANIALRCARANNGLYYTVPFLRMFAISNWGEKEYKPEIDTNFQRLYDYIKVSIPLIEDMIIYTRWGKQYPYLGRDAVKAMSRIEKRIERTKLVRATVE